MITLFPVVLVLIVMLDMAEIVGVWKTVLPMLAVPPPSTTVLLEPSIETDDFRLAAVAWVTVDVQEPLWAADTVLDEPLI